MRLLRLAALASVLPLLTLPKPLAAQAVDDVSPSLLADVMPEADRFDPEASGNPPVRRAYRGGELIGYVFHSSDVPPEPYGYAGPIETLIGMAPDGTLTGVRVVDYRETYRRTRGDFLRRPGFQEQFTGKSVGDAFRVRQDVDGISRVTISVRAMSRTVRQAGRQVAAAYLRAPERTEGPVEDVLALSWYQMRVEGVAERFALTDDDLDGEFGISLVHLETPELAEYLVGGLTRYIRDAVEERAGDPELILYAVDGSRPDFETEQGWSISQDGVTHEIPSEDVAQLGAPWEGMLWRETQMVGVIMLRDQVDLDRPLTFHFDRGPDLNSYALDYTTQRALRAMAEGGGAVVASSDPAGEAASAASGDGSETDPGVTADASSPTLDASTDSSSDVPSPVEAAADVDDRPPTEAAAAPASDLPAASSANEADALVTEAFDQLDFLDYTEAQPLSPFERMIADAAWGRVGWIALVLSLAMLAFFTKRAAIRWVSLAVTLAVLGYVDGGFLSVSHITSAIWVGPDVFLGDLPLLIMVVFTLTTLVFWGRIFCGYLCPFGALQDIIDGIVPKRFQRELPRPVHRVALKAKYGILTLIIVPALLGSHTSLYQYFEPFGTVFTIGNSPLLWSIAGGILLASTIVPRFYCRYMCPLGAALAVGSLVTLRRIPRVEQCQLCTVCERKCPTGAIDAERVDFKECVRCNVCEIELIHRTGVCRHDMETIRPRLVQLKKRAGSGAVATPAAPAE